MRAGEVVVREETIEREGRVYTMMVYKIKEEEDKHESVCEH